MLRLFAPTSWVITKKRGLPLITHSGVLTAMEPEKMVTHILLMMVRDTKIKNMFFRKLESACSTMHGKDIIHASSLMDKQVQVRVTP